VDFFTFLCRGESYPMPFNFLYLFHIHNFYSRLSWFVKNLVTLQNWKSLYLIYLFCHFHISQSCMFAAGYFYFWSHINLEVRYFFYQLIFIYINSKFFYSLLLCILLKLEGKNWVTALRISLFMDFSCYSFLF
jgi:hypothetical protein